MSTTVWQAVLSEFETMISRANFETWFRHTKLASIDGSTAIVNVPNIFIQRRLESYYRASVLELLQKQNPQITNVVFMIDGSVESTKEVPVVEMTQSKRAGDITPKPKQQTLPSEPSTIVSHQTFDTFVEGTNNRLAYTVSQAVAKSPGTLYNPLFIYGGVGLGKTHLMHAIANEILGHDTHKKALYVSCEKFTNDYIASITSKNPTKFKQTYRTVDVLLVDDIQFLGNKEGSQEEFFNTFNTLHQSNRQIVIAADRVPTAIPGLEERLSSRFGWGMIVDIQPPNLETRIAILQSKCLEKGITISPDAIEYVATQVQSNIRELEGALNRVIVYCQMTNVAPSLESTRAALSGLVKPLPTRKTHSVDSVLSIIADHFQVSLADLIGPKRQKELVYPRHVAMYVMREEMEMSFPVIGREMGGKDHTTIMHGYNKIANEISSTPTIQSDLTKIKERLAASL